MYEVVVKNGSSSPNSPISLQCVFNIAYMYNMYFYALLYVDAEQKGKHVWWAKWACMCVCVRSICTSVFST